MEEQLHQDENNSKNSPPISALRSDDANEIISPRQGFIMNYSLVLFSIILLLLTCLAWLVRYPDVVSCKAILISKNEPKELIAFHEGRIQKILVANNHPIKAKQPVAWIESNGSHVEILRLSAILDSVAIYLSQNELQKVSESLNTTFYNLGELQSSYQQFSLDVLQFNDYLVNGFYYQKKNILKNELVYLINMHNNYAQQKGLAVLDLELSKETFDANTTLYKDKVISKQEIRDQKSKLVNKQMSIPQLQLLLLTNENQQNIKIKEIAELDHSIAQQKQIFQQAINSLKNKVQDWIRDYVIIAPINGKISFNIPIQEGQFVKTAASIGYVSSGNEEYVAQINLAQYNFGKVKIGQAVQLRFDAYPYEEFGFVPGKLNYISSVATDSGFTATVELPIGLLTSQHKVIQYRSRLKSNALIITKDMRLLERFYYGLIKLIDK